MRLINIIILFTLLTSCSTNYKNVNPIGKIFPTINGTSLNGQDYQIPYDFKGDKLLFLIGFNRKTHFDIDRWTIGLNQTNTQIKTIELPATQGWFPIFFDDLSIIA